jgi:hypothetical protein
MRQPLWQLAPGTRFRLEETRQTGTLVSANSCRAVVHLDAPVETAEFVDGNGAVRSFECRRTRRLSWAPSVVVTVLNTEESPMSATKTKKKVATKRADAKASADGQKPAKTKKAPAKKADGKMSAIDAAAKVLGESKEALNTKTMIERMASKGYWTSPGGKTPHATLYSAILREINEAGKDARFVKVDRGLFKLAK